MAVMSEKEADELDDLFTRTTPKISVGKTGVFSNRGENIIITKDGSKITKRFAKKELSFV